MDGITVGTKKLTRKFKFKKPSGEEKSADYSDELDKFRVLRNGSEMDSRGIKEGQKVGVGSGNNPNFTEEKKPIDWDQVKKLAKMQCTQPEVAGYVELSLTQTRRRCEDENGMPLAEFLALFAEGGKASLRRTQWNLAKVNPTMAIHLGKHHLGQTDKQINLNVDASHEVVDLAKLPLETLLKLSDVLGELPDESKQNEGDI